MLEKKLVLGNFFLIKENLIKVKRFNQKIMTKKKKTSKICSMHALNKSASVFV